MRTIVVGVDGSPASRRALAWAIDEARLRDDEVVAVHAWTFPVALAPGGAFAMTPNVDFRADAVEFLEMAIRDVTGGANDVTIKRQVVQGGAAPALLKASEDADMLVIGSRGLGGFGGLMLGSVGQQCAHHAPCPVVIIPHDDRATERRKAS